MSSQREVTQRGRRVWRARCNTAGCANSVVNTRRGASKAERCSLCNRHSPYLITTQRSRLRRGRTRSSPLRRTLIANAITDTAWWQTRRLPRHSSTFSACHSSCKCYPRMYYYLPLSIHNRPRGSGAVDHARTLVITLDLSVDRAAAISGCVAVFLERRLVRVAACESRRDKLFADVQQIDGRSVITALSLPWLGSVPKLPSYLIARSSLPFAAHHLQAR